MKRQGESIMTKTCTKCKTIKSLDEFYSWDARCKQCIKEIQKQNYQNNKDKIKTRVKKYAESNKDKCNEASRNKRRKNPEVYKEISKRSYQKNKEQKSEYQKQHRTKNPELYRNYCRRRRALRKNLHETYTKLDIEYTMMLFNNMCANCNSSENLEIDHHIPLSSGHILSRNNAVVLCRSCNAQKHNKLPQEFYTEEKLKHIENLLDL